MSQTKTDKNYLKSLSPIIETIPESDEFNLKKHQRSFSKNNFPSPLQYTNYNNSYKSLYNNNNTLQNSSNFTRYNSIKLPLIQNPANFSFYKMKRYVVPVPKIKNRYSINKSFNKKNDNKDYENENKKDSFSALLLKTEIKKNDRKKTFSKYDENKVMDFNDYLKMQSIAEWRLRPKIGDTSLDLVNYINKVAVVRKNIMDNIMKELNNAENRYNSEKPEVDSNFRTKDKILLDNRWKNAFSLDEYQKFFEKNLKGKISSMNYRSMIKKFREISLMCFYEGNLNLNAIKRMSNVE